MECVYIYIYIYNLGREASLDTGSTRRVEKKEKNRGIFL
jgi:hypothetical protein